VTELLKQAQYAPVDRSDGFSLFAVNKGFMDDIGQASAALRIWSAPVPEDQPRRCSTV
jgi:F0F1-type ATP synthase alpha subunit